MLQLENAGYDDVLIALQSASVINPEDTTHSGDFETHILCGPRGRWRAGMIITESLWMDYPRVYGHIVLSIKGLR
jgi:hypothetical protein